MEQIKKIQNKIIKYKTFIMRIGVVITFVFSSCNSENETPVDYNTLPESIAKDFSNRYGANTIKQVCSGNNYYRHTGQQETYVYCEDKAGDELLVVYLDNVWNRSILTLSDVNKLPFFVSRKP
ncbi:MAG: hypothetical protein SO375_04525 [Prevotella sp.]|nr:hypothetical protein [Prevotella sp.]